MFAIEAQRLSSAINAAIRAAAANSNLLFKIETDKLWIAGANSGFSIKICLAIENQNPLIFSVPKDSAIAIVNLINKLQGELNLSVDRTRGHTHVDDCFLTLTIKSLQIQASYSFFFSEYSFPGDDPTIPEIETASQPISLPPDFFRLIIGAVVHAAYKHGGDYSSTPLESVRIAITNSNFAVMATDGFRIAEQTGVLSGSSALEPVDTLLPLRVISYIRRLPALVNSSSEDDGNWLLTLNQSNFSLEKQTKIGRFHIKASSILGLYPSSDLLQMNFLHKLTLDRASFLASLERAETFADAKNNHSIQLIFQPDLIEVRGAGMSETLNYYEPPVALEESFTFTFNCIHLTEALKATNASVIDWHFNSVDTAIKISAANFTEIVMPILVVN